MDIMSYIALDPKYTGQRLSTEDPATFKKGPGFNEWKANVINICSIMDITEEVSKINVAKELIDKNSGNAWGIVSVPNGILDKATTLEEFYQKLMILTGDPLAELVDEGPFIACIRFMALEYKEDMDVGKFVGLKRGLLKDFFRSLEEHGVTTDDQRMEVEVGSEIIGMCPLRMKNVVNNFTLDENSNDILKRVRDEADRNGFVFGDGMEETIRDRELKKLYAVYFPYLLHTPRFKANKM